MIAQHHMGNRTMPSIAGRTLAWLAARIKGRNDPVLSNNLRHEAVEFDRTGRLPDRSGSP